MKNDEDWIRAYLRGRADVPVPDDLRLPSRASVPRKRWSLGSLGSVGSFGSIGAVGRLALAGLLVVVIGGVAVILRQPTSVGPAGLSSSSASSGMATGTPFSGPFPAELDGLPVLSVAQAMAAFRDGESGGEAVAVAGYYDAFHPSCPYPGRYIGPLEH